MTKLSYFNDLARPASALELVGGITNTLTLVVGVRWA